ncbi:MAG: diadenylate cyclase [Planctomycetia bacterium]|jgi:DNA integrity scanning protein DisA with diadenylate cyclase activity|nr:diadenylate cyclase [Planctomycetia bacterium]
MSILEFSSQLEHLLEGAARLFESTGSDALLLLVDQRIDWNRVHSLVGGLSVLVAADEEGHLAGAADHGLKPILLDVAGLPVHERLTQALLECVAAELIAPEAQVVAIYSGFEAGTVDSVSVLRLEEHLGQLTSRDLRNLETKVPLETLKIVVDLAVEIGREGREGKPVGTLFVVGDTRKVMQSSHATGFDPVRGYSRAERRLTDPRVREGIKEIAQLDGAFVVGGDGTVEGAARYIDASAENVSVAKGLGARHWAAAAITRRTKSVAVAVSETNGTVRLFQNGEVVLRIEPFRRAMKWKDFEYEPPSGD